MEIHYRVLETEGRETDTTVRLDFHCNVLQIQYQAGSDEQIAAVTHVILPSIKRRYMTLELI
jgi:extradiol dioxygenase family protein